MEDKDNTDNENNININKSKQLSFELKPNRLKDKNPIKYFDKLTDVLISFQLFPFFNENEILTYGRFNTKFYNSFIRYCKQRFDNLEKQYNINLKNEQNIKQNELYEQKDDKGHFIKFGIFSIEHYSLFAENKWTWQEDLRYWNKVSAKNSILNKEICNLIQVCWVDVNQTISHVFNGKYKLYLNHCICNLSKLILKLTVLLDGNSIYETKYPSQEQKDKCRERHAIDNSVDNNRGNTVGRRGRMGLFRGVRLPMKHQYKVELKENRVDKDYITEIIVPFDEKIDNDKGHTVTVRFDHIEGSWKQGWMIDAFILEKIIENINSN